MMALTVFCTSLSEHQMQYFHKWHNKATCENIIAGVHDRVKYNLILHVKQINFLFISCFNNDFVIFLPIFAG